MTFDMLTYTTVSSPDEVQQILALQKANHPSAISAEELADQGFVTVQHRPEVLQRMNNAYPSIIAKDGDRVAGYCLVMLRDFAPFVPELGPLFERLETLHWEGRSLKNEVPWFVMGQVCVDKPYRGMGAFDGMYQHLRTVCQRDFELVLTSVSERNPRSLRAHYRVGFQTINRFSDDVTHDSWHIVALLI